tara:strand:+ start:346 stop:972 length:627 start_codon:yes stop_codon:yes gene_type:complete
MNASDKLILDLCGGTGSWAKPYKEAGYNVKTITIPEYDVVKWRQYQDIYEPIMANEVYGILAAPPCTMFSYARTNAKAPRNFQEGMYTIQACMEIIWQSQMCFEASYTKKSRLKFWSLENTGGFLKNFLGKPTYTFNPYDFGDNYKKKTCLWGYFNEPKKSPIDCDMPKFDRLSTKDIHGEFYGELTRTERRSITPQGFAKAFFEANK